MRVSNDLATMGVLEGKVPFAQVSAGVKLYSRTRLESKGSISKRIHLGDSMKKAVFLTVVGVAVVGTAVVLAKHAKQHTNMFEYDPFACECGYCDCSKCDCEDGCDC